MASRTQPVLRSRTSLPVFLPLRIPGIEHEGGLIKHDGPVGDAGRRANAITGSKYPAYALWKRATPAWLPFDLYLTRLGARREFWTKLQKEPERMVRTASSASSMKQTAEPRTNERSSLTAPG